MMLEGRRTLVWGTIAAAVVSALWLGATDGSLPRLGGSAFGPEAARAQPALALPRSATAPAAPVPAR